LDNPYCGLCAEESQEDKDLRRNVVLAMCESSGFDVDKSKSTGDILRALMRFHAMRQENTRKIDEMSLA